MVTSVRFCGPACGETGRPHRFWDTRIVTFDDFVTLTRFLSADVRG